MTAALLLFIVIQGTLIGFLCSYVAGQKNRSKFNWFILGFFFSLLALVALVAIPALQDQSASSALSGQRSTERPSPQYKDISQTFIGPRNLDYDAYKIWLVERFKITRNEALNGLTCNNRLFPTIEDALVYADQIYSQEVALRASARPLIDTLSTDEEIANYLGITFTQDRYIWNGNHFKSIAKAIEFAKLHQTDVSTPVSIAQMPANEEPVVIDEDLASLIDLHGIKYEEGRFVWQGNHFRKAADAIAYVKRNQST